MKLLVIFLILSPFTFSQWGVGASYKIKNEIPENGISINISRKLPLQFATIGVKVRAEVDLFRQKETQTFNGISKERNFTSEDYHIEIIGNFFLKDFSPYIGFGIGYGKINVNQLNKGSFLFILLAGLSLPITEFINPYLEAQCFNYLSGFDPSLSGKDISSFQFRAALGIGFSINTIP